MVLTPRDAFYAAFRGEARAVPVASAEGRVCAETIAAYPPGCPVIVHGERLTAEVLGHLAAAAAAGAHLKGASDPTFATVRVFNHEEIDR